MLQRDKCPTWGQKCLGCGGQNHFKSVCKNTISTELSSEENDVELLAGVAVDFQECDVHTVGYAKEIHAEMHVNPLRPGDKEWRKAVIIERPSERSYVAETSDGIVYRRNRAHLKKTQESPPTAPQDQEPPPVENPAPEPTSKPDKAVLPGPCILQQAPHQ